MGKQELNRVDGKVNRLLCKIGDTHTYIYIYIVIILMRTKLQYLGYVRDMCLCRDL